jgi:hypothetical protein
LITCLDCGLSFLDATRISAVNLFYLVYLLSVCTVKGLMIFYKEAYRLSV